MFWIINAVLVLIALAFVLPTLLRKRNNYSDASREQNIHIANEQLEDLETRFERGELESEDYQATRDELEQSLFDDINDSPDFSNNGAAKSSPLSALLIALLIPAITIPVYLEVGSLAFTEVMDSKLAAKKANDALVPRKADGTPDIDTMIASLQKKMEADPENLKGWYMLGRSYMVMDRYSDALKAFERALKLKPESVDIMLSVADSLSMSKQGDLLGRPAELVSKALEKEPNNVTALWLSGMAARQGGKFLDAIKHWQKVLPLAKPEQVANINSLIDEARNRLTPEQKQTLKTATAEVKKSEALGNATGINVTISLSDKFKSQVNPTDLVFIYAKAMSGPPMPLAAIKKQVKDLPIQVTLNDAMAMMPSLKLSSFSEVIVGARVSKSGQPISQNGDLFSEKSSVKAGDSINIEIDAIVIK